MKSVLPYVAVAAIVVGFINFFWFFAESAALGGDALNGNVRAGHYFVGSHGSYTEVSEAAWTWSRVHGISVFITHPIAIAGMAYVLLRFVFPSMMAGRATGALSTERVAAVSNSGSPLASARTGGKVGEVVFSGPMLRISVYPGGIVIKPAFMRERAILASEIRRVVKKSGILGRRVEIEHAGVDSTSPFVISGRATDGELVQAIESIAAKSGATAPEGGEPNPGISPPPVASQRGGLSMGVQGAPAGVMDALGAFGLAVNFLMIGIGVLWAIPQLGAFGFVWTLFAIFITVSNVRRVIAKR
ncbi:MAG TPA: hypothetical protein VFY18_05750 [Candidatus Limnocylindrales bacterium]|nr:hypothetical protein [Candidatus Limnocylindrales bacterium]